MLMYAPNNDLTLILTVPYLQKEMDHTVRKGPMKGRRFTTESEGLGDVRLAALYNVWKQEDARLHLNVELSFPTGSITERDATPLNPRSLLPYPMQIGSGTVDLIAGGTYLDHKDSLGWGIQSLGTFRIDENRRDYRLGHRLEVTTWLNYHFKDWFSPRVRLKASTQGKHHGADPEIAQTASPMGMFTSLVPTAFPEFQGGEKVEFFLGGEFFKRFGDYSHRLDIEVGIPVYEKTNGPMLETDFTASITFSITYCSMRYLQRQLPCTIYKGVFIS